MNATARYVPGRGTLLGRGTRWLLLDRPLDPGTVRRLWDVLDGTAHRSVDHVVAEARRVGAGAACAVVDTETGDQGVHGPVSLAPAGEGLTVTLPGATGEDDASGIPITGGAVAATILHVPVVPRRRLLIDGVPDAILSSSADATPTEPRGVPVGAGLGSALGDTAGTAPSPTAGATRSTTGATVGSATRIRPQPSGVHPLQQSTGETVLAARCVHGHLTTPERPTCRNCGADVPPQTPLRVPRPPLGQLVLPDGQRVLLDRSVVLGRRPEPIPGGETWPHLVELPADRTHLSRQHALVELDGWRILARDLGSRSGTMVRQSAGGLQPMQPHRTYVVDAGNVLVLADDFLVRVVVELSGDTA